MTDKQFADAFAISQMSPRLNMLIVTRQAIPLTGWRWWQRWTMYVPTAELAQYVSFFLARPSHSRWPATIQRWVRSRVDGASALMLALISNGVGCRPDHHLAAVLAFATRLNRPLIVLAGGCLGFAGVI